MILEDRIEAMSKLGRFMMSDDPVWLAAKSQASLQNGWFTPEYVDLAVMNISRNFLITEKLKKWANDYNIPDENKAPKNIGIVMAGNIPLVGFHDFLSVFIWGHKATIKPSSKDDVLIHSIANFLSDLDPGTSDLITFADMLKNCDAYIATGSNNTSRYFDYYFGKYPHILRRNKTSVAILDGSESNMDLDKLGDDVYQFFGLGCRNVTKIYVPRGYNFEPLLRAFDKFNHLADHHKYKNNYDYNLAIHILNNKFYMTNGSLLVIEDQSMFSPISQLNYQYYDDKESLLSSLHDSPDIQCIVGHDQIAFGEAQCPGLSDYADKSDTMAFLKSV